MPSDTLPPAPSPARADLYGAIAGSAATLQAQYLGSRGQRQQAHARGQLAVLRRSAGFTPEQHPLALQSVLDSLHPLLEDGELGTGDTASRSERAAFDAMCMFALHMQSATRPMHVSGRSFGSAMGMLRIRNDSGSLKPRFDALLAARNERARLTHARSLVTLLRGEQIGLDYGRFAQDLRTLASSARGGVLLRWGRDFAVMPRRERERDQTSEPTSITATTTP
ncbi:type I-E CRISPR-associated protein Cse2/CasB [Brachybacterium huguangmaarense]|uniref:Type I-E CRISPR-associated protein Cse2/CasB n=1 Tax=Brachybacterium huguangmaarense TaxID=1652028 RepID=A0ABY6G2Q6_9MICO|nr:type I-E CRISPR-associated protein Cse2/CasB [Brachybacterium huguangmaarense]UYG17500.1 type I-E CRISPR-associated protein Cse2/CasB [Brachybacterium huguangmaarense]